MKTEYAVLGYCPKDDEHMNTEIFFDGTKQECIKAFEEEKKSNNRPEVHLTGVFRLEQVV